MESIGQETRPRAMAMEPPAPPPQARRTISRSFVGWGASLIVIAVLALGWYLTYHGLQDSRHEAQTQAARADRVGTERDQLAGQVGDLQGDLAAAEGEAESARRAADQAQGSLRSVESAARLCVGNLAQAVVAVGGAPGTEDWTAFSRHLRRAGPACERLAGALDRHVPSAY